MQCIMSFWSKPFISGKYNKWHKPETFYLSWLLSYALAKKHFGQVKLYTDQQGKELLVDKLGLDFDEVEFVFDKFSEFTPYYPSITRAFAAAEQVAPFVHIDYDAFLWEPLPESFTEKEVFFEGLLFVDSNRENGKCHLYCPHVFRANGAVVPEYWDNCYDSSGTPILQTGIFGGKDGSYFRDWCQGALDIAQLNDEVVFLNISHQARGHADPSDDVSFLQYGSPLAATCDGVLPGHIVLSNNWDLGLLVNKKGMNEVRFTHVGLEKHFGHDLYERLYLRLQKDFPERLEACKKFLTLEGEQSDDGVSLAIVPDGIGNLYDVTVKAIVPRKIAPDEVVVLNHSMPPTTKKLIQKIEEVTVVESEGATGLHQLLNVVENSTSNETIIVLDGHVKVPKLYIEKILAARNEFPNAIFCTANDEYSTQGSIYGGMLVANKQVKPIVVERDLDDKSTQEVEALYGGLYVFPRDILRDILNQSPESFGDISFTARRLGYEIRCIRNLSVSHGFATPVPQEV